MRTKVLFPPFILLFFLFSSHVFSQKHELDASVEFEGAGHLGDNTPLWQVSNRDGLPSIDNYAYLRGILQYQNRISDNWRLDTKVDLVAGAGIDAPFVVHQAYADIFYRWLGLSVGSKERHFEQLNPSLSSGGLVWSGNCRPIPQIRLGAFDYVQICRRFAMKAEIAYGWFTDDRYQKSHVGPSDFYTTGIKYHNKNFYMRIGDPNKNWVWEMGYRLDTQFGGVQHYPNGKDVSLGSGGWRQYWEVLFPQAGGEGSTVGEQIAFSGNVLGSELLKLTYQWKGKSVAIYMENYFDDFSGMGKLNGMDGLFGFEYRNKNFDYLNNLVVEYYQSTNQSGPMHGVDFDKWCKKTGGGDNYYNNYAYPGWTHWGRSIGTPLAASPMYNDNGVLSFLYTRVKAVHIGVSGNLTDEWDYRFKMTFNKTWGTVFKPTIEPLSNFSAFAEFIYCPKKLAGWSFTASVGGDTGEIYGDNLGMQLRIRKDFSLLRK